MGCNDQDVAGEPITSPQEKPSVPEQCPTCGSPKRGAEAVDQRLHVKRLEKALSLAIKVCVDMAVRYDEDIEGCDGDELLRYGEGITCCFRLAYILKYGKFPPEGDAWSSEFAALSKILPRGDVIRNEYAKARAALDPEAKP
jgi:hypothetical protein